jgi:hypothetical protein
MEGVVIGAVAGAFVGWLIIAVLTEGPKYPGDQSYSGGPGCLISLATVIVGAIIGAAIGALVT